MLGIQVAGVRERTSHVPFIINERSNVKVITGYIVGKIIYYYNRVCHLKDRLTWCLVHIKCLTTGTSFLGLRLLSMFKVLCVSDSFLLIVHDMYRYFTSVYYRTFGEILSAQENQDLP